MTRVGKIARLPHHIREELNQRLHDGEIGRSILSWLNSLAETRVVLSAEFDGHGITHSNLSDWRRGGYRDWEAGQFALAEMRRAETDAPEAQMARAAKLKDFLVSHLIGRLIVAVRELSDRPDKKAVDRLLHRLCRDYAVVCRAGLQEEAMRISENRLALQETKFNWRRARRSRPS